MIDRQLAVLLAWVLLATLLVGGVACDSSVGGGDKRAPAIEVVEITEEAVAGGSFVVKVRTIPYAYCHLDIYQYGPPAEGGGVEWKRSFSCGQEETWSDSAGLAVWSLQLQEGIEAGSYTAHITAGHDDFDERGALDVSFLVMPD